MDGSLNMVGYGLAAIGPGIGGLGGNVRPAVLDVDVEPLGDERYALPS